MRCRQLTVGRAWRFQPSGSQPGPGSYTGLRIGVSSAKGICVARSVPLVAVPTLHTFASAVVDVAATVLCLLHARADEWYGCVLAKSAGTSGGTSGNLATTVITETEEILKARVASVEEWLSLLDDLGEVQIPIRVATPSSGAAKLVQHREAFCVAWD